MAWLAGLKEKAAIALSGMTPLEQKVFEATNNDAWGPHGNDLKYLASASTSAEDRAAIFGILWKRVAEEKPELWRHIYKSLSVFDYLIANGDMACVQELRDNVSRLKALSNFQYKNPEGKDDGINVRHKSNLLVQLLSDPSRVQEAREKAAATRNKYSGVSSDDMRRNASAGGSSTASGWSAAEDGSGSAASRATTAASYAAPEPETPSTPAASGGGGGGGGGKFQVKMSGSFGGAGATPSGSRLSTQLTGGSSSSSFATAAPAPAAAAAPLLDLFSDPVPPPAAAAPAGFGAFAAAAPTPVADFGAFAAPPPPAAAAFAAFAATQPAAAAFGAFSAPVPAAAPAPAFAADFGDFSAPAAPAAPAAPVDPFAAFPLGGAPAKPAVQPLKGAAAAPAPKATSLEESLMANLAGLSMNKQTSQPKLGGW